MELQQTWRRSYRWRRCQMGWATKAYAVGQGDTVIVAVPETKASTDLYLCIVPELEALLNCRRSGTSTHPSCDSLRSPLWGRKGKDKAKLNHQCRWISAIRFNENFLVATRDAFGREELRTTQMAGIGGKTILKWDRRPSKDRLV